MLTFKKFLQESGKSTSKFETTRANKQDILAALEIVSKTLHIPVDTLKDDLLGTTKLTLSGKKKDSGDIDIAMSLSDFNMKDVDKLMLDAVNGEGSLNLGTKVGSYAVPVNGKKVQVDLMFVPDKSWAKFAYHSAYGTESKYPGAVRNIILTTALAHTQEPGKDFVIRDNEGRVVARASKSMTLDTGMKRLFKKVKRLKSGELGKTLEKTDAEELAAFLKELGKDIKFSKEEEFTNNPDHVAEYIFGKNIKAKDIMTAEDVITLIKKLNNSKEILDASRKELEKVGLPIPSEL